MAIAKKATAAKKIAVKKAPAVKVVATKRKVNKAVAMKPAPRPGEPDKVLDLPFTTALERQFHVSFFDHNNNKVGRIRYYKELDTACRRIVQLMILDQDVGCIGEVYHAQTGLQYGTLRKTATGRIIVTYNEDTGLAQR